MPNEVYFPNSEQFDLMNVNLARIASSIEGGGDFTGFEGMQRAVRSGLGPTQFPVGAQFTVTHSVFGTRVCEVLAHDYLKSAHDANAHTMTCRFKNLLPAIQFDAPEAFYFADESIPAGTYHFQIATEYSKWAAGTYQFTLANALPKGGQLGLSGNAGTAITSLKVNAYASQTATATSEQCTITAGSGGVDLGAFGNGLNHSHRVSYGSNNYKESAMRQHLISSAAAGAVWKPQTKYDRPPSWVSTLDGLVAGFPADFLATVGEVNLPCVTNNTFESQDSTTPMNTAYTLHDKFYLLSSCEVFGSKSIAADESKLLPYFEGATNADRIGYRDDGTAALQWLRTPLPSNASSVRIVISDGSLNDIIAGYALSYAPAFTII